MQYMLMFYEPKGDMTRDSEPATQAYFAAWMAYVGAIRQAGIVINGDGLQPPATATTLRIRGDQRQVQDGPFADTKEQLGGYFIVDVPTLDSALEWAARAPCASTGGVEVRPVMMKPGA